MPEHPGFVLRRIKGRSLVRLRVRPYNADAAREALQLPRPLVWKDGDPATFCLGPDQWLLASDRQSAEQIVSRIDSQLAGRLYAAIDVSSCYTGFALSGPAARMLLAMGCGIDMRPGAFAPYQCVSTQFARIQLVIVAVGDNHFDLYLDRSLASYLEGWIEKAGEDPITHNLENGELI